jgi:hypothetical protein
MSNIQRLARNDDPSVDSLPVAPDHLQVNEVSSPSVPHKIPERGVGERVTVGYFDREGVDQLRRTLTHFSEAEEPALARILSSESVSVPPTGPFDFERTLRTIMKKCVIGLRDTPAPSLSLAPGVTLPVFNRASSESCSKISVLSAWEQQLATRIALTRFSTPRLFSRIFEPRAILPCATF